MNEYLAIIKNYLVNTDNYIPLYIALGFLFINYIIALIKSRNESIIAISGWGDLIIVLSPIFGFLIMMVIGIVFMPETNTEEFLDKLLFYYFISFRNFSPCSIGSILQDIALPNSLRSIRSCPMRCKRRKDCDTSRF